MSTENTTLKEDINEERSKSDDRRIVVGIRALVTYIYFSNLNIVNSFKVRLSTMSDEKLSAKRGLHHQKSNTNILSINGRQNGKLKTIFLATLFL